ncbi:HAD-IC family P-type ATPase [Caldisalinibacter kiritimatiensis]|uniref:Cd(2+)-exporting ATPase n=1 Tax=Caldisalinibacter kiritimatiensis TaxID=1304284 RepID=R1CS51_9FIRM|nr:HAD-IC family P-type ATPase [Caldisalinibacter kiritimatiensis]EOC99513.1 Lead, cadmium, zinc and mercury transporting ATPase / Copper-translocating P-type ATPase [Caldisalinibacter kiritimatiensis]
MEVLSYVPGRIRIKEDKLYKNEEKAQLIEFCLKDISGIKKCNVNPILGTIVVKYDVNKMKPNILNRKIKKLLNANTPYLEYINEHYKEYIEEEAKLKRAKKKMLVFGGIYILYKIKQFFFGKFYLSRSFPVLTMASIITITKGYPTIRNIYNKLGQYFPTNSDKLLVLVGASFTLMREGNKGTMLLFLKAFTDALQSYTELEYKKQLLRNNPNPAKLVWYCYEDKEYLIPLKALEKGDTVVFNENEVIPVVGGIIEGNALVNYMYYTGQPEVRYLRKNDKVYEGMVITSGKIKIRINKVPEIRPKPDLALKELDLKQRLSKYRKRQIYRATTMAAASYLITGTILSPLSVLLVMSPSASKVAFNAGMSNTLKLLLKHKIILRNINTIERIINAKSIVFDKTGTLTKGRLRISKVDVYDERYTEEQLLEICASCESNIHHPVAYTLTSDVKDNNSSEDIIYIPSKGVISNYKGHRVVIGNESLIKEENIELSKDVTDENGNIYYLPIYVAIDNKLCGKISMIEELENNALEVVNGLRKRRIYDISIISGDLQDNVSYIGDKLNISNCHGEFSIQDKQEYIKQKKRHGPVLMVGDGVNDTYAMKVADVSISYNTQSSEQAVQQSDCILAEKEMKLILDLLDLTQKSYSRIERNIIFSQSYNFIFGILSMLGYINPFKAKTINTMNSIISMINSGKINKLKTKNREN